MTREEPSLVKIVRLHMEASLPPMEMTDDGVRVTTHCMYPSNGLVRVYVKLGRETAVVSDEGEAVGEVLAAGVDVDDATKLTRHVVADQGLSMRDGIIFTPSVPLMAIPAAVPLVANAAKDVAAWLYEHKKIKRTRDFRKMLTEFLSRTFDDRLVVDDRIVGASNKSHKFANVIRFPNGAKLVVDSVARDSSSINSRVVANLDVRSNNNPSIFQRIVYDDDDLWPSADLNLLSVGAPVIPFSRAAEVISRVAERARVA